MKTTTMIAVAFVTLAGVGAAAAISAQADGRWQGREGGPAQMMQQAHGGGHHVRGDRSHGGRHGSRMLRMMETFDGNDDGKLSQEEIDAARGARFGQFDGDGDQSLTLQEYERLWLDAMRERMVRAFQRLDTDGDAQVTAEEFQAPYSRMVRRMDRNEDGVIDRNDFHHKRRAPQAEDDNG